MKVKNLLILVLIGMVEVAFLSYPVYAESGNLIIDTATSNSYTKVRTFAGAAETYNQFYFDTANYNTVTKLEMRSMAGWTFPKETDSTAFTITAGGSGSGFVSYSSSDNSIIWYFSSGSITSSPITLSYTTNIFSGIGCNVCGYNTPVSVTSTEPMKMLDSLGTTSDVTYIAQTRKYVRNNYNIVYSNLGNNTYIFNTSIDKSPTVVNTKIRIMNLTNGTYFQESTFNAVSFSTIQQYNTGIKIFMNTSTDSTSAIINSTGLPGLPPGNGSAGTNPTNITKPASGANIGFDKSSYFVGDNVNISWYYSDDSWNSISQKKLKLYLNDIPINTGNAFCDGCIDTSTQSGYYIYQATSAGTLKVNAELGTIFVDVIGTASVSILPSGTSWIALNKTSSYAKQAVNVTYHIGYSVASYPAAAIEIDTVDQANGNVIDSVFPTSFPDGNILIGVIHPIPAGTYAIKLYDAVKNKYLDTKYLTVILVPSAIPVAGITTSSITTDKSSYFYNDYMQIDFKVDDVNYSNYSIRGEVLDINQSIVTKRSYSPFSDQVGTFTTVVNIDKNQKCEKNLNCWFDVGNNSIQIIAYNSTNSFTIAYANFTVTSTTPDGYGLQISTQSPKKGEQFTITTIVPSLHTGKLTIMDSGYATNFSFGIIPVPSGTTTTPYTIFRVNSQGFGYYDVILYGDDGLIKGKIPITISSPLIVPTIPGQTGSWTPTQQDISKTCSWLDNWVQLVFSEQGINDITRFMFSLLIIGIVMVMALIASENNFGVSIIIGFLPYSYFVYLSQSTPCGTYMPTWTIVFIALIIAVKQRWF